MQSKSAFADPENKKGHWAVVVVVVVVEVVEVVVVVVVVVVVDERDSLMRPLIGSVAGSEKQLF